MRTLNRPPEIDDTANLSLSLKQVEARRLLQRYRVGILDSYQRYTNAAPELSHFQGVAMSLDAKKQMRRLFGRTKQGSLSHLRTALKRRCHRCPYCNISASPDLDHFLPQDSFPCLAILSWNLVPICPECNRFKERGPEGAFIHSYFDQFPEMPFLHTDIAFEPDAILATFRLDLTHIATPLADRIRNHFEALDLRARYALVAQDRLSALRLSLPGLYESGGAVEVRAELQRKKLEASLYGSNSWEHALMSALASSNDYCDGGFLVGDQR